MRDVQIYLTQVYADIPTDADRGAFPLTLPFVEGLDIRFRSPVTFLEALVDIADLPVRGGGRNELADHARHPRGAGAVLAAFEGVVW